ncbi:hypothetical protein EDD21DRAFT_364583 [Dissophora ornata]|nr:hypothetical protein EDD21DRAFT_364583 [Dissophora ornata]
MSWTVCSGGGNGVVFKYTCCADVLRQRILRKPSVVAVVIVVAVVAVVAVVVVVVVVVVAATVDRYSHGRIREGRPCRRRRGPGRRGLHITNGLLIFCRAGFLVLLGSEPFDVTPCS